MNAAAAETPAPLGPNTFPFSTDFLDIEQYKSIGTEALTNIGLGFAMIAVVVLVLVANPVAAVLTFVNVASAILELVGFMYFQGTYIDSVSVIFLVISLGLAVDYSVHVASGFLSTRIDDSSDRLTSTMAVRSTVPLPVACVPACTYPPWCCMCCAVLRRRVAALQLVSFGVRMKCEFLFLFLCRHRSHACRPLEPRW